MLTIEMSALQWDGAEDFYIEVLPKPGAPPWHGHNLDAMNDSVFGSGINKVEPPFRIVITDVVNANITVQGFLHDVQKVFANGRGETGRDAFIDLV